MRILTLFIELLFPSSQRRQAISQLTTLPARQRTHSLQGLCATSLMDYHHQHVRASIHEWKYLHNAHATALLATVLADALLSEISEECAVDHSPLLIVPIPSSHKRIRERGFDHLKVLLNQVITITPDIAPYIRTDILIKHKHTQPQTKLSRAKRLQNIQGTFILNAPTPKHARIILIDDVYTTGATLTEAARVLTQTGARVSSITLAHSYS